jgi:molybdopterin/thiamine biosynthesis adenylyltransferase
MTQFSGYLAKAYYASRKELEQRVPELRPLTCKTIAVVGLGCLGAPSALEFAKAGVGDLRLVDPDKVDPATVVRWPWGFQASGHSKVELIHNIISRNYPYTKIKQFDFRIGSIRNPDQSPASHLDIIEDILADVDLIYDTTAELGVQQFLSDWAWTRGIAYVGVSGTFGGWGGKAFRIRRLPGAGCWFCYRCHCDEGTIPEPPSAPDQQGNVQPTGCADPTFTGAGFDMLQIALSGVRLAVSTLCEGVADGYPAIEHDAIHIGFRSNDGQLILPSYRGYSVTIHPECRNEHISSSQ